MTEGAKTPKPRSGWPMAAVAIALILVVGVPAGYLIFKIANAPGRVMDTLMRGLSEAAQPKVTVHELVISSVDSLHRENKLVVMTAEVSTEVTREEGSTAWGIYWGTNVARVAVKNARVQYVIDCGKMEAGDFVYDERAKTVTVTFPRPRVDTTMVAIDPAQVMTLDLRGGWARFDKLETKDRALAELKPKIITEAAKSHLHELAETRGIEAGTKLLQPMADALGREGVTVKVGYRPR